MILLASIISHVYCLRWHEGQQVDGVQLFTCYKLKAAVEAKIEVEVKIFLKVMLRYSNSWINSETVSNLINAWKNRRKLFKMTQEGV